MSGRWKELMFSGLVATGWEWMQLVCVTFCSDRQKNVKKCNKELPVLIDLGVRVVERRKFLGIAKWVFRKL